MKELIFVSWYNYKQPSLISWKSTSYNVVIHRWRYKMYCASWLKMVARDHPLADIFSRLKKWKYTFLWLDGPVSLFISWYIRFSNWSSDYSDYRSFGKILDKFKQIVVFSDIFEKLYSQRKILVWNPTRTRIKCDRFSNRNLFFRICFESWDELRVEEDLDHLMEGLCDDAKKAQKPQVMVKDLVLR